jgi:hypothetical protein
VRVKESLRTKDKKQAAVRAKPVMMKFDRILAQADATLVEHPVRTELTEAEIKQIAEYFYAHELGADEELREEGIGSARGSRMSTGSLPRPGQSSIVRSRWEPARSGLSARMMHKIEEDVAIVLPAAKQALARGSIDFIWLDTLLQVFRIDVDLNALTIARWRWWR